MKKSLSPKQLRSKIREARNAIPPPYAKQASYKFSEVFGGLESYQAAKVIGGFLPFDGEADPLPLMDRAILEGKSVFVPIIVAKGEPLLFAPWTRQTTLAKNKFGIEEPDVQPEQMIAADKLEFVITPLVAFDEGCNRMGVGGGFYDRSFQFLNAGDAEKTSSTTLVGIAFELQKVPKLDVQSHDVSLNAVVTELTVYER